MSVSYHCIAPLQRTSFRDVGEAVCDRTIASRIVEKGRYNELVAVEDEHLVSKHLEGHRVCGCMGFVQLAAVVCASCQKTTFGLPSIIPCVLLIECRGHSRCLSIYWWQC